MTKTFRIGQIVPSSNTTMETEVPAMLQAHSALRPQDRFTFHSSRMRMKKVQKEELAAMDAESDRCALELSDARVDVLGYACLVAIMAMGTIRQKPWVVDGEVRPRMVTTVGGSFDHRVVDGDVISRFVADVASVLEEPALLLD